MPSDSRLNVCHALVLALADDPFYRAITIESTSDRTRQAVLTEYFVLAITEAEGRGEVQSAGSKGAALWITDEVGQQAASAVSADRQRALQRLLGPAGMENYHLICESMEGQIPGHLAGAWYLSILGVHPDARGQGLAQRLLMLTLERADRLHTSTYLETFNSLSLAFYRRLGFTNELSLFEERTGRPYWLLWRAPS